MGFLDRIFGTSPQHAGQRRPFPGGDAYALERYRYMLQTAPPDTIEQAHAEAFEQLTSEQRRQLLAELAQSAPPAERLSLEQTPPDDVPALARAATRAEVRKPGSLERVLGTAPGAGFGAGLLGSFAAAVAGSLVANAFFSSLGDGGGAFAAADDELGGVSEVDDEDLDGAGFDGIDYDV